MSFAAAVQWWEDWQLRLLVLASLFFQYFLFVAAIVRKRGAPHWFRALIWLAYQGGDVMAIYALAILFNRHKAEEVMAAHPGSAHLDTLWAPVLLLHLGGQDGITAYSIEDNENWRRHLLVSVVQITVAIYVFRKSWWSGDIVLLRTAILLFVPGILKCLEKPWALKNATVTSINSSDTRMKRTLEEDDDDDVDVLHKNDMYSQELYVQAAAKFESQHQELFEDEVADEPYHLFVDLGHPYSIRLRNLQLMAAPSARADVHALVRSSLSKAFDRLYTKHRASFGGLLRAAVVLLTFADIGLFQRSHRHRVGGAYYDRGDVVVTYVLLCCTAALEFVSACLVLGRGLPPPADEIPQYNLVGYLARNEKRRRFWAVANLLGARLQLDRLWCTAPPEPSSLGVTRLVYDHVAAGWKDYIKPMDETARDHVTGEWWTCRQTAVGAYRRFNDSRGQRTLDRERCRGWRAIEESMRMPFDESVLLWHLATEFCYFDGHVDTGHDATRHSRTVSNYMAYLLVVQPEILIPGARRRLFRAAYHELRKMLKPPPPEDDELEVELLEPAEKKAPPPKAENEMVRKVIQQVKCTMGLGSENVVHMAWAIVHELKEFAKDKRKEFIRELEEREEKRKGVKPAMKSAKETADRFIQDNKARKFVGIHNCKEQADKLAVAMENAKEQAQKFIDQVKKAEGKIKQTKEEKKMTDLLNADMFSKQAGKIKQTKDEQAMVLAAEEFSKQAWEVIRLEEEEGNKLKGLMEMNLITKEEELLMIRARESADDRMWAVIQGVWVEMLCFSAGRCRGYLHAKSLGNGGEYLSYVWLLLSYMGMETMPERMQRPELPVVGDTGAVVKRSMDDDEMDDEPAQGRRRTTALTPRASSRPGATTAEPSARTAQAQQRLVVTPMPAMSATAVVPIVDDIV